MIKKRWWIAIIICIMGMFPYSAFSQRIKLWKDTEHLEWFEKYKDAEPEFKPGDVITYKDADKIRPFLPPEFQDVYIFPEMKMEIMETTDYKPYPAFEEATKKYGHQTKLGPKGELLNYAAGVPFPEIKLDDLLAGLKCAWNFEYRWQVGGLYTPEGALEWRMRTGKGVDERALLSYHRRYYHSHRADMPEHNYTPPVPEGGEIMYKEITGFTDPFDVKDTAFIVFRYLDPMKDDDGWAYVPALRRVRRVSMATRSDSLMGTDHTLDDFYGFSGKVGDYKWKLLGKKKVLAVANSKYTVRDVHKGSNFYKWYWYGPKGWAPNDRWQLRDAYVVETISKDPRYPYSRKFLYWDDKLWHTHYFTAYDRKGEEWRIYQLSFADSERVPDQKGLYVQQIIQGSCFDIQADRCTVVPVQDIDMRPMDPKKVKDFFDIMSLLRGR